MTRWIIYCHTNKQNDKRYVGFTKTTLEARWKSHLKHSKMGSALLFHNAIRKYGPDSWYHDVICEVNSLSDAFALERFYIELLGTWGSLGYNMNAGGEGGGIKTEKGKGWKHSEATRKRMSESHKGLKQSQETIAKRVAHLKGHKTSEETKEKLRQQRGWKHSNEAREKIRAAWARKRNKNEISVV